jgi:hypothetical protein
MKPFLLGLLTAYGIYFITRKGPEGRSILDDLLDRPDEFLKKTKDVLLEDTSKVVRDIMR